MSHENINDDQIRWKFRKDEVNTRSENFPENFLKF